MKRDDTRFLRRRFTLFGIGAILCDLGKLMGQGWSSPWIWGSALIATAGAAVFMYTMITGGVGKTR